MESDTFFESAGKIYTRTDIRECARCNFGYFVQVDVETYNHGRNRRERIGGSDGFSTKGKVFGGT